MVRWSRVVLAAAVCFVAPLAQAQLTPQQQALDPLAAVHQLVAAAPTQHEIDHLDRMIDLAAARTHSVATAQQVPEHVDTSMLETETVAEAEAENEVGAETEVEAETETENEALGLASTLAGFGRDTGLARLTKLSQSLAATKHTVERQRHQITADETKLQRLRRLIAENKETLVRNERALAASSQQYLKAVEQYTTQVNEAVVESLQATQEAARAQVASLVGGHGQRGRNKPSSTNAAAGQSDDSTPSPKSAPKLGPEDDYAEKLVSGKLEAEQKAAARARVKYEAEKAAARAAQAIAQSKTAEMKERAAATAAATAKSKSTPTPTPSPAATKSTAAAAKPVAGGAAGAPKRSMISLESQLAADASVQADSTVSLHAAQVSEARRAAQHAEEMARLVARQAANIGSQYAAETTNTALPTRHQQDFAEFKAGLARLAALETQRTDSVQQALNMPATAPSLAELEGEPVAIFLEMEAEADPAEEDASTTKKSKKKLMKPRIIEGIVSPPLPPAPVPAPTPGAVPLSSLAPCPAPVTAGKTALLESESKLAASETDAETEETA